MCESDPKLEGLLHFAIVYSHKTWLKHLTIYIYIYIYIYIFFFPF